MPPNWIIWVVVGYICGSVSFALAISRLRGVDIRQHGSGNVGATNVGRVLGRQWGILCFVLDVLKGLVPVLAAGVAMGWTGGEQAASSDWAWQWQWLAVAVASVVGHVFPVWLKFKGGKGVATGLGAVLGFWPIMTLPALVAAVTWVAVVKLSRYVSLASIVAAAALPIYVLIAVAVTCDSIADRLPFVIVAGLMGLLVIIRHRSNISRLIAGTESKIAPRGGGEKSE